MLFITRKYRLYNISHVIIAVLGFSFPFGINFQSSSGTVLKTYIIAEFIIYIGKKIVKGIGIIYIPAACKFYIANSSYAIIGIILTEILRWVYAWYELLLIVTYSATFSVSLIAYKAVSLIIVKKMSDIS